MKGRKAGLAGAIASGWLALAVSFIGPFEGLRMTVYRDIVGVPTVCYGETRGVRMGDSYSREDCDAMLGDAIIEFESGVRGCLSRELAAPRRVAMVSLAYNIGVAAFCRSTLVRLANEGAAWPRICDEFLKWNRAGGRIVAGLTRRRQAERELCLRSA